MSTSRGPEGRGTGSSLADPRSNKATSAPNSSLLACVCGYLRSLCVWTPSSQSDHVNVSAERLGPAQSQSGPRAVGAMPRPEAMRIRGSVVSLCKRHDCSHSVSRKQVGRWRVDAPQRKRKSGQRSVAQTPASVPLEDLLPTAMSLMLVAVLDSQCTNKQSRTPGCGLTLVGPAVSTESQLQK